MSFFNRGKVILFGIVLRRDRYGINIAIRIKKWEKIMYLYRYPILATAPTAVFNDPTDLTEVPTGKVYGPEDMNGVPLKPKLIGVEDM